MYSEGKRLSASDPLQPTFIVQMTHTWFIGPDNCPLLLTLICAWLLLQFSSARSVVVARHPCMHVQMQHQPLATLTRNIRVATASLTANNAENKWQLFRTRGLYNNDFKFLDRSTYCDLFDQSMHLPDNCNACMLVSVDLAPGYRKKNFSTLIIFVFKITHHCILHKPISA